MPRSVKSRGDISRAHIYALYIVSFFREVEIISTLHDLKLGLRGEKFKIRNSIDRSRAIKLLKNSGLIEVLEGREGYRLFYKSWRNYRGRDRLKRDNRAKYIILTSKGYELLLKIPRKIHDFSDVLKGIYPKREMNNQKAVCMEILVILYERGMECQKTLRESIYHVPNSVFSKAILKLQAAGYIAKISSGAHFNKQSKLYGIKASYDKCHSRNWWYITEYGIKEALKVIKLYSTVRRFLPKGGEEDD